MTSSRNAPARRLSLTVAALADRGCFTGAVSAHYRALWVPDQTVAGVRRVVVVLIVVAVLVSVTTAAVAGRQFALSAGSRSAAADDEPESTASRIVSLGELLGTMNETMAAGGVNALASTRVIAYAAVAYHDAALDRPALVASAFTGQRSRDDGLAAAVQVYRELTAGSTIAAPAAQWVDAPGPGAAEVARAVLDRAAADGFTDAASARTDWVSPPPHHHPPLEPGWGTLRSLVVDAAVCPVPPPPPDRPAQAEREAASLDMRSTAADRSNPRVVARTFFAYPGPAAPFGVLANPSAATIAGLAEASSVDLLLVATAVAAFDVSVAAAGAIWADPQPGPLELLLRTDPDLWGTLLDTGSLPTLLVTLPLPAYPSLDAATAGASGLVFDAFDGPAVELRHLWVSFPVSTGTELTTGLAAAGAGVFYLDDDITTGVELGRCVARKLLETLGVAELDGAAGG
jgi:hypothetical protein